MTQKTTKGLEKKAEIIYNTKVCIGRVFLKVCGGDQCMTAVLIPAYEPEMILVDYVRMLSENGFAVVVADDGSGPE